MIRVEDPHRVWSRCALMSRQVSSMNRAELVKQLNELKVNRAAYRLDGGLPNECYTLEQRATDWAVYYSERGRRSMEHIFSTEAQACQFLFDWIAQSPALADDAESDRRSERPRPDRTGA
jgi:hypothetical protein